MENRDAQSQSMPQTQKDCPFVPGEVVARSGLYEICHYREPHTTVILTVNSFFPSCRSCGDKVRYRLLRAVPHISEDPDFKESLSPDSPPVSTSAETYSFPLQLGLAHGFRFSLQPAPAVPAGSEATDFLDW